MSKRNLTPIFPIILNHQSTQPLYQQLYSALQALILKRQISGALPSTRRLAAALKISRTTVINAYEQLLAEGYIEGKGGAGTYVVDILPEQQLHVVTPSIIFSAVRSTARLSQQGAFFQSVIPRTSQSYKPSRTFPLGIPALDAFPFEEWRQLVAQVSRNLPRALLAHNGLAGYEPLRKALASYLVLSRAVKCDPSQIIIVTGTQQAIDLAARLLLDPGDEVLMEDPGYLAARRTLQGNGAVIVPVPVDEEGLDIAMGVTLSAKPRLAYITPSHQFPLGVTMKLARRLRLLEWASQFDAWIIEDDYDSELRFTGRPLPSLQGLDNAGRVIYIGTFNKILFPMLRVGYMVVPSELASTFAQAHLLTNGQVPIIDQVVLTKYLQDGYFERHVRRMRALYAERQAALLDAVQSANGLLEISANEAGMHVIGWLPPFIDDWAVAQAARRYDVLVSPLSAFSMQPTVRKALLLGFAAADPPAIYQGIRNLTTALQDLT